MDDGMQIDYNILRTYGGVAKKVAKDELIYEEGSIPRFYFQVIEGEVVEYCSNAEGKELIQGFFGEGKSFGEPSLLMDKNYPSSARATKESVVVKITKNKLQNILRDYPDSINSLLYTFANRLHYKSALAQVWVSATPEDKILHFLVLNFESESKEKRKEVTLTRQQIANYTGLRVETVIRTLKKMSKENVVEIKNRKLYY